MMIMVLAMIVLDNVSGQWVRIIMIVGDSCVTLTDETREEQQSYPPW